MTSKLHDRLTLDDFDWTAMRSDDTWMREGIWRDDARIAARVQAAEDAAADEAAGPMIQFLLGSRTVLDAAQINAANRALATTEPGLRVGAVTQRTAAKLLGSYFTPAEVIRLLG